MSDASPERDWTDDPDTFTDALDDLKEDGCLLLVLESAGSDASVAGCRRMLGDDVVGDRRRLFVLTDTDARANEGLGPSTSTVERRALAYRSAARGTVAADSGTANRPTASVESDLDDLADAVETEIDALSPDDDYDPGQLRVCVDALDELMADNDLLGVLEFTKTLRGAVRDADGIAHVHVGTHLPAVAVEGLLSQFDAVVEVTDDDDPRQRWHLPDESLSTKWLEL